MEVGVGVGAGVGVGGVGYSGRLAVIYARPAAAIRILADRHDWHRRRRSQCDGGAVGPVTGISAVAVWAASCVNAAAVCGFGVGVGPPAGR